MKVFVINLAKSKDRMTLIQSRLERLEVDFERVDAVYGKNVPQTIKDKNSSRFWWRCIKGYPMRDGEYGCAMSHLSVYQKMVAENVPVACVLEDDAVPRPALPTVLDRLQRTLDPCKRQVALISNHRGESQGDEFALKRITTGAFADAYVLTHPAAKKLLQKNLPIKCPADDWTFWARKRWIELFQVYPEGANQEWEAEGYASEITTSDDIVVDVRKMTCIRRLIWKIKRVAGLSLAYLILK